MKNTSHQNRPAVVMNDVSFSYRKNDLILENVHIEIAPKKFTAIVGPNGGGKSTLLKLMLGLLSPSKGCIEVLGCKPIAARGRVGYVPQYKTNALNFPMTALETVMMGRLRGFEWPFRDQSHLKNQAMDVLKSLGVASHAHKNIDDLSGGLRQRVLIGRAIIDEPDLLLLDEPTANQDPKSEEDIYHLLSNLSRSISVVMVSHDVSYVSAEVDHVACVNKTLNMHASDEFKESGIVDSFGRKLYGIEHNHPDGKGC